MFYVLKLEAIKAARGLSSADGSVEPLKPLSEVLRENKERKEAEFAGVWKNMKIGTDDLKMACQLSLYHQHFVTFFNVMLWAQLPHLSTGIDMRSVKYVCL